jgi:hypothetical protein
LVLQHKIFQEVPSPQEGTKEERIQKLSTIKIAKILKPTSPKNRRTINNAGKSKPFYPQKLPQVDKTGRQNG